MAKKIQPREAGVDANGKFVVEPHCGQCSIDLGSGKTYCNCGYSYEERVHSGWKLDGERKPV